MSAHDLPLFSDQVAASRVAAKLVGVDAQKILRLAIEDLFPGRIALVSSFGADSAVLLHMIAHIDKTTPVIFIDTLHLFSETLAYRDDLIARLDLRNVITVQPDPDDLAKADPETFLWSSDPDACCDIRKVQPMAKALDGLEAWISGRKQFQSETRTHLPLFEAEGDRIKINPLAGWSATRVLAYFDRFGLPHHRLVAKGYPSIGCIPCTSMVKPGEDGRAGRWRGRGKVECGIHTAALSAGADI